MVPYMYRTVQNRIVPYRTVTVLVPYYERIGTGTVQYDYNVQRCAIPRYFKIAFRYYLGILGIPKYLGIPNKLQIPNT